MFVMGSMGATYVGNANGRPYGFCHDSWRCRTVAEEDLGEFLCGWICGKQRVRRGQICAGDLSVKGGDGFVCDARIAANISQRHWLQCNDLH
jgi:hypothetical protein